MRFQVLMVTDVNGICNTDRIESGRFRAIFTRVAIFRSTSVIHRTWDAAADTPSAIGIG